MSTFNVWVETEEVDDGGDQIQELDHLCHKLGNVETEEEADELFQCAVDNHIAFARLKQFCQLAEESGIREFMKLREETMQGLNMVGLRHMVE